MMKATLMPLGTRRMRSLVGLALVIVLILSNVQTTYAGPPALPSRFWGEVHITDGAPAVGDAVQAYVTGYGSPAGATTIIDNSGTLMFAIDVNGDNTDTPTKDGGVENDAITFKIGTRTVATGVWHSGTNVQLNFHPPAAAATNNGPRNEGSAVTINASTTADWGADISTYAFDCNNDGTYEIPAQAGSSATCTFSNNGTFTVGVRVLDAQGGEGTVTTSVQVLNVAPVVTLSGNNSVNEGTSYSLGFSATDAGTSDTITGFAITWGDGSAVQNVAGTATSATHTFTDGPLSPTISVTATDNDGGTSAAATKTITVNNVAPTVSISGSGTVNEGATYTLTLNKGTDPGDDTLSAWAITWGDGSAVQNLAGTATSATHAFADGPANYTISATATDEDNTYNTNTIALTVGNVAPTTSIPATYSGPEGSAITLTATASDVAGDPLTYAWNTGSGFGAPNALSTNFTPADDTSYTVTFRACDDASACSTATTTVTGTNVLPTGVTAGGPYTGKVSGAPVSLTGAATCPAADSCTYAWDLDNDGLYNDATGLTATYTWYTLGNHPVSLQANDGDGTLVTSVDVNVTVVAATHSITLYPGWNLVSFNVQPTSTAPENLFSGLAGNYDLVYAWDNTKAGGGWLTYATGIPASLNTLTAITPNMGFWIHITGASNRTLTVTGPAQATTNIALTSTASGWNLVGYPAATTTALPGALTNHGASNATLVFQYVASDGTDPWKLYDKNASAGNDLNGLAPGWGYWIYATSNNTWHVEYP